MLLLTAETLFAQTRDVTGTAVRYRGGSSLSFDTSITVKDEDSGWFMGNSQLGRLAYIQTGRATNFNHLTVTNFFSSPFKNTPVVICTGGTNDQPYLITVTTTNVIFGAIQTNATIHWVAMVGTAIQSSAAGTANGGTGGTNGTVTGPIP